MGPGYGKMASSSEGNILDYLENIWGIFSDRKTVTYPLSWESVSLEGWQIVSTFLFKKAFGPGKAERESIFPNFLTF